MTQIETLGNDLCNKLLLVHAYSGCNSTSRIFDIGKKWDFQKLLKSYPVMKSCASAFILQDKTNLKRTYQTLEKN